ncbi:MAG: BamA/TamA family outer membrane protein [Chitinophagaceae bacterium]|nr:BamA/TamA family outer membrane protein [Chitinophagaceae bacterium]
MRLLTLLAVCFLFCVPSAFAQPGKDSVAVKGSTFNMKSSRTFWMGTNYRKEWNTPVKAPVINLATEKGGLTPIKKGGGKQTKSLRLEDASGRQYTIRSIQKFITDKTLPGDLQSEAAADLVSDGVSASYPYASLSMQVLADAAGVPYGKVKLIYIPDDPKLGEYRKDFSNMLATLEERLPEGVDKGYDTDDVADKLEKDNDNRVDQQALLRARILDMFVMDLDRHEDQWQWGATDNGKGKTFFPIPRDRDQAFYINQGLLPGLAKRRSFVPQLEGFKQEANSIRLFNFAARNLDRFFLNEMDEEDWKQATEKFLSQMTDQVIEKALAQQPAEIRDISSGKIIQTLKARRNYLLKETLEYFHFLSEIVNVTGSDKKEMFEITRNDDGSTTVTVFKIDKEGQVTTKMYERKFDPMYTKEIRLYGFDGEDKFVMKGTNDKIKVRMIGGGGEDSFENTNKSSTSGLVYDRKDGNNKLSGKFKNRMANDSAVNSFKRIYYDYNKFGPSLSIGFNPDDGLSLGVAFKLIRHGFRKEPYKSSHTFAANHSLSTSAFRFRYSNEFIGVIGEKMDLTTDIDVRSPNNITNFFGYGINTVYDKTKPGKFRYYRARYDLADASLLLRQRFSDKVMLSFGPTFQYYEMDADDKLNMVRYISQTALNGLDPTTVNTKQKYFGALVNLLIDTRDHRVLPSKGVYWENKVRYLGGLGDTKYKTTQLSTDFSIYLNLIKDRLTFANRIGAGVTTGDNGFEFHQAQYLGSEENLRGFRKFRFAGKTKFYNQAELRLRLANFKTYLFPAAFGLHAFVDAGRVWVKNDADSKMKVGYGGGFWFSPLRRILLSFTYAMSDEDKLPLIGLGFKF